VATHDRANSGRSKHHDRRGSVTELFLVLIATLLLSGCTAQHAAIDDAKCTGYGLKPGTDAYAQCRYGMDTARDQRRHEAIQGAVDSVQRAYAQPAQPRPPISCTSVNNGGIVSTTRCCAGVAEHWLGHRSIRHTVCFTTNA
jgi:hypothetical protein